MIALESLDRTKIKIKLYCDLDDAGNLRIYYRITDFGTDMISRYLG